MNLFFQKPIRESVLQQVECRAYDLTWIEGGDYLGWDLVKEIRDRFGPVVSHNTDDPFGTYHRGRFLAYRKTFPLHDLVVVPREPNVEAALRFGVKRVMRVYFCADEVGHAPRPLEESDRQRWGSDVVFIGTWRENRGTFLADLMRMGIPLSIYGERWQRSRHWPLLRQAWHGSLYPEDDYAKAIQCAKVSIGLLSKGVRDLHTSRSMEILSLGGVLCAERTVEHTRLYREGEEAVFWSDAKECAHACLDLLADPTKRERIAQQGRRRCIENGHFNEQMMAKVLEKLFEESTAGPVRAISGPGGAAP